MFERFTPEARRAVVAAQEEARLLKHKHIDTEHFLLGLIHPGLGIGTRALESLGVSLGPAREQVIQVVGRGRKLLRTGHIPFTPRAKKVLELTLHEALALGHEHIGTEHMLLSIIQDGTKRNRFGRSDPSAACKALVALGVDLEQVRLLVLEMSSTNSPSRLSGTTGSSQVTDDQRKWPLRFNPPTPD